MKARKEVVPSKWHLRPLLIGALVAVAAGAVCMAAAAGLMTALDIPASVVTVLSVLSASVGAFFGGLVAAKISGTQGWLCGLLCGTFLFLCILLAGLLLHRGIDVGFLFIKLPILLVGGMLGGMVGVSKK